MATYTKGGRKLFDNRAATKAPDFQKCDQRCRIPYPLMEDMWCRQCGHDRYIGDPPTLYTAASEEQDRAS